MKPTLSLLLACAFSPLFAQTPELLVDANGIPTDANYTLFSTGVASRGQVTATQSLWANYTGDGNIGVNGTAGLTAANGATLYHAKVTGGLLTGTPASYTFTPNSAKLIANGNFKTASLWLASGRTNLDAAGRLANAGSVYACGGQLWFSTAAETISNPVYLGAGIYEEANNFNNAAIRVEKNITLSGTTTVLTPAAIAFNSGATLTLATLAGTADLTIIGVGAGTLLINDAGTYTGTLISKANATLSFGPAVTHTPAFTLDGGAFRPLAPITLGSRTALVGTLNLDTPPPAGSAMLTVPAGATLDFTGATLNFAAPAAYPFTYKVFDADPGATVTGWNGNLAFTLGGAANPFIGATMGIDGTITLTPITDPVAFTAPSAYWTDTKTFPSGAVTLANAIATKSFGLDNIFLQTIDGKASTVAQVTGGGGKGSVQLFGMHQYNYGNNTPVTRDIWLKTSGGAFALVAGGAENDWQNSRATSIVGDILVELSGNTIATNVVGGSIKGGYSASITGNTGIVIQDNAIVTGSIIGSNTCAHNQTPTQTGHAAILIKNVQSQNAGTLDSLPAGHIIGGGAWTTNISSCTKVDGDTSITIDLPAGATGTFVKTIIGGNYVSYNPSSGMSASAVTGRASVTINAPPAVTFNAPIYGASRSVAGVNTAVGSTAVTLNGGTYTSTLCAGGNIATSSVETDATLILNGGTFTGATLRGTTGGAVGGTKALVVNADIDLRNATVSDFDTITIAGGSTLTVGANVPAAFPPTTGGTLKNLTLDNGQSIAVNSTTLENLTLNGGALATSGSSAIASGQLLPGPLSATTGAIQNTGALTIGENVVIDLGDLLPGTAYLLVENNGGTVDVSALGTDNFTRHGTALTAGVTLETLGNGSVTVTFSILREPCTLGWTPSTTAWKTSETDPEAGYTWDILAERVPTGESASFMIADTACFLENGLTGTSGTVTIENNVFPGSTLIAPGEGHTYTFTGSGAIGGAGGLTVESGRAILTSAHTYTGATAVQQGATLTYAPENAFATDFTRAVTGAGTVEIPFTTAHYNATFKIGNSFSGTVRVTAGNFTLNTSAIDNGTLALADGVNGQYTAGMNLGRPFIFEGSHQIHANSGTDSTLTGLLTGTGFTKKGAGTLRVKDNPGHALTGTVTADVGTLWWGTGSGAAANGTRKLGSELAISSGATATIHLWTTSALTSTTTDKAIVDTKIRFNGGTLYSEDGSYTFNQGFEINGSGTFKSRWTKGWVIKGLNGNGTFNLIHEPSADVNFSVCTLTGSGTFTGALNLISTDTVAGHGIELRLNSANAATGAIIDTGAVADRTRLAIGTAATAIAGLTGSAPVTLVSGTAAATLTVNNPADCAFNGAIAAAVSLRKTGAGTLALNTQTYANAITVANGATLGGDATFTGPLTFETGAQLAITPSAAATGIPTFSGSVAGQAKIILPETFKGETGLKYYIAKGSALTAANLIPPAGHRIGTDETGLHLIPYRGIIVTLL